MKQFAPNEETKTFSVQINGKIIRLNTDTVQYFFIFVIIRIEGHTKTPHEGSYHVEQS